MRYHAVMRAVQNAHPYAAQGPVILAVPDAGHVPPLMAAAGRVFGGARCTVVSPDAAVVAAVAAARTSTRMRVLVDRYAACYARFTAASAVYVRAATGSMSDVVASLKLASQALAVNPCTQVVAMHAPHGLPRDLFSSRTKLEAACGSAGRNHLTIRVLRTRSGGALVLLTRS